MKLIDYTISLRGYLKRRANAIKNFFFDHYHFLKAQNLKNKSFFILNAGRSGSTLLVDLLNKHSKINCKGELLHDYQFFPLKHVLAQKSKSDKIFGFKINTFQLFEIQKINNAQKFLDELIHKYNFQIIYLKRENCLEQALSNIHALKSKEYHLTGDKEKIGKVSTNISEIISWVKRCEEHHHIENNIISGISTDVIKISYEDDLKNGNSHQETCNRLYSFLDLESEDVKSKYKKRVKSYKDSFKNWDKVLEQLESQDVTSSYLHEGFYK